MKQQHLAPLLPSGGGGGSGSGGGGGLAAALQRLGPSISSAFPMFLLGSVFVLLTYQLRLGAHQAAQAGDDAAGSLAAPFAAALPPPPPPPPLGALAAAPAKDTLVVYLYNEDDPVYKDNFDHFVVAGVAPRTRADHVVLVQERSLHSDVALPSLPEVRYVYYAGTCFEWGAVGWLLLQSGQVDWRAYRFFVLVSSAVRGPFVPPYLQGAGVHWTELLTSRLNEHVKLVGPTVVCGGAPSQPGAVNSTWRHNPHIPFSAVATDIVGLEVLLADRAVTGCHKEMWEAKYHSEVGSAAAVLGAGYGLDCLLIRYQNVDWSDRGSWGCNRQWDPAGVGDFSYDGTALDPLEALFVRVNSRLLAQRVPMAVKAAKYSAWAADVAAAAAGHLHNLTARVSDNRYAVEKGRFKLPRILAAMVRGIRCFDVAFFLEHNRDIFQRAPRTKENLQLAWKFWVYLGQFEDRPFRFACDMNFTSVATPAF